MKEKDSIDLGKVNVYRLFGKYFFPTLMGMICVSAVTAIDGVFVGHNVGSDGIAAVNLCVPIYMLCTGLGLMFGAGSTVVASIHLSKGKTKAARLNVTQAVIFSTIVTLVPSIIMWMFPDATMRLLGASDALLPMAKEYMVWFVPSMVFDVWLSMALFVVRLDGSPRYAMWCSVICSLLNAVLDWLFIPILGWGVMGAAFASSLSIVLAGTMAMAYIAFTARKLRLRRLRLSRRGVHYFMRNIRYQCAIGSSAFIGEITMATLALLGNYAFEAHMGDDGVGAFGIACYYTPFVFMGGNAIIQSAQPIISFNYGSGSFHRVHQALRAALLTAVTLGALTTMTFCLTPGLLIGLFVDTGCRAARLAAEGFPLFSIGFTFFILNLVLIGYCQSLERAKASTAFSLLRGFVFLIPSFVLVPKLWGDTGVWLALSVSETLTFAVIAVSLLTRRRCGHGIA